MKKEKVLITGIAGLLGSNFAHYLLENRSNVKIIGIDDLSGGLVENIPENIKFYNFNICKTEKLKRVFEKHKPDYVYHFAAMAAEGLSNFIKNNTHQNNLISSVNLINECVKNDTKKIIFTSSMAVYGDQKVPFLEQMTPKPVDSYGISKYAVEMELKYTKDFFNLDYTIIRPHNVVGKRQCFLDPYRNVIAIWINNILNNKPITIYGDGSQIRAFSDIRFYMKPFEKLMNVGNSEIYNIGSDKTFTILEAAEITKNVAFKLGYKPDIVFLEPRKEVKVSYCDHQKAKLELDFFDETNLEQLISDMFVWARTIKQNSIPPVKFELEKNLYSYWKK